MKQIQNFFRVGLEPFNIDSIRNIVIIYIKIDTRTNFWKYEVFLQMCVQCGSTQHTHNTHIFTKRFEISHFTRAWIERNNNIFIELIINRISRSNDNKKKIKWVTLDTELNSIVETVSAKTAVRVSHWKYRETMRK